MSSLELSFFESKVMGQQGSVENILDAVNLPEIAITDIMVGNYVTGVIARWNHLADIKQDELKVAYEHEEISFHFLERRSEPERVGVVGHIEIKWSENSPRPTKMPFRYLKLSTDGTAMFTQKKYSAAANCARLLDLAEKIYNAYEPVYGWIERDLLSGYTTKVDIDSLEIPHIYWANFFEPLYVEKYGRKYFEDAPGWKCHFLADGGCLYVLSPDINRNKAGEKGLETEVKEYFGINHVRKKTKPRKKAKRTSQQQSKSYLNKDMSMEEAVDTIYQLITESMSDNEQ